MTDEQRSQFDQGYWFEMGREEARQATRIRKRTQRLVRFLLISVPVATLLIVTLLWSQVISPSAREEAIYEAIRDNVSKHQVVSY